MQTIRLIDAHCHLDFPAFDQDRTEVIRRAKDSYISDIVVPGTQKKYWGRIRSLCEQNPHLHACYGLHPYWADKHGKQDIQALETYITDNRPVAVGECGLDFRPQQSEKQTQLAYFEAQLVIASNLQLPVVVHSVKATETVIQSIKKFNNLRGMVHSFSGSSEQARQLVDLGFYISTGATVTYPNANKIRAVVREIPLTSLLLETDAPDQPDHWHADERNEPAYLINTLNEISALRNETVETIARQTTNNAKALFNID